MKELFTNTVATAPTQTAEQMLAAIEKVFSAPRLVGSLMGAPVYVSSRVPDQVVEIHGKDQVVRFRLDHPYVKGTKLERDLRSDKR